MLQCGAFLDTLCEYHGDQNDCLPVTDRVLNEVNSILHSKFTQEDCKNPVSGKEITRAICFTFLETNNKLYSYRTAFYSWIGGLMWCNKPIGEKDKLNDEWSIFSSLLSNRLKEQ